MTIIFKTVKKISVTVVFTLLFFSFASASEIDNSTYEYDSMYRYNAMENNSLSPNLLVSNMNLEEKSLTKSSELPDDTTKELQDITLKQNYSTEKIDDAINTIKNRGEIKTFFVGNNLGVLKFQIVQIKNLIFMLNDFLLKTASNTNKTQIDNIDNQIKSLQEEQTKAENFILEQNKKFSLFGWFVTSF